MTVGRVIMAPFRLKAIGIDFFHYGAAVGIGIDRENIAAALNPAKQQSFV